jgi:hypothetical protein
MTTPRPFLTFCSGPDRRVRKGPRAATSGSGVCASRCARAQREKSRRFGIFPNPALPVENLRPASPGPYGADFLCFWLSVLEPSSTFLAEVTASDSHLVLLRRWLSKKAVPEACWRQWFQTLNPSSLRFLVVNLFATRFSAKGEGCGPLVRAMPRLSLWMMAEPNRKRGKSPAQRTCKDPSGTKS